MDSTLCMDPDLRPNLCQLHTWSKRCLMARSLSDPWMILMDSTLCMDPDLLLLAGLFKLADEPDNLPRPLLLLKSEEKRQYEP